MARAVVASEMTHDVGVILFDARVVIVVVVKVEMKIVF